MPRCCVDRCPRAECRALTDNDARLRDALRVFLSCDSSYKHAADERTLHSNTVKYSSGARHDKARATHHQRPVRRLSLVWRRPPADAQAFIAGSLSAGYVSPELGDGT